MTLALTAVLGSLWLSAIASRPAVERVAHGRSSWRPPSTFVAVAAGACGFALVGPVGVLFGAVPSMFVRLRRIRRATALRRAVIESLPGAADLLAVSVSAGNGPAAALSQVAARSGPALHRPLQQMVDRVDAGASLDDELVALRQALGEDAAPLTRVLRASLDDGVALAAALRGVAAELRLRRRRAKERAIASLPMRLLFPLVLCILPAFVLMSLVPVLVDSVGEIGGAL